MLPKPQVRRLLVGWALALLPLPICLGQLDFDILGELYPEDFFQLPKISQHSLSPSGEKYAYAYNDSERNVLYVVDLETSAKTTYAGRNPSEAAIQFIDWKSENQIVFQTTDGDIFSLNLNTGKRILIFDGARTVHYFNAIFWGNFSLPRIISMSPSDDKNILVSAFDRNGNRVVYKVSLLGKDSKEPPLHIKPTSGITSWHADYKGNVRLGVKTSPNKQVFYYREPDSKSWTPLNQLIGDSSSISVDFTKSNFLGKRDYFAGFGFDPNVIYIASNKETDTTSLYSYDLKADKVIEKLAHDPEYDFFDISVPAIGFWVSEARQKLLGIPYHRDKPSVLWLDDKFRDIQTKIDEHLPDASNIFTSWNQTETKFIVASGWSDKPIEHYIYDLEQDSIKSLGSRNKAIDASKLKETRVIELESRDGRKLHGYLTMAESDSDKPPPLVMLPHGGPWARDHYAYDPAVQWLAYNGYSVLQINYRGSTGYGYEHYIASKNDFGWGIQNDIEDAVDWAIESGFAEAGNLAIMGFSYGGYATMLALASQPGKYRCGIAMSGIYDLLKAGKNVKSSSYSKLTYAHFKEMVGREWNDKRALREISPAYLADKVKEPVMLVHGKLDLIASYSQSELMESALKKNGKRCEFITIEDEGHGFYIPRNQIEVYASAVEFLDKHFSKN